MEKLIVKIDTKNGRSGGGAAAEEEFPLKYQ